MHLTRCTINFDKRHAESQRKLPGCNFTLCVWIRVIFQVGIKVTLYVSLRKRVRRTLVIFIVRSDGEVYEKGEETLVTPIEVSKHLIACIPGHAKDLHASTKNFNFQKILSESTSTLRNDSLSLIHLTEC